MAPQAERDYYEMLGVSRSATQHEIESAFQHLASEFHAAGKPKSNDDVEWLRQRRKAYDVLIDANRRASYDRTGDDFQSSSNPPLGYDYEALKQTSDQVDYEINRKHGYWRQRYIDWWLSDILEFLGL